MTRVGSRNQKWFLKGSRILLPRQFLWRADRTPQRGLKKLQSPELIHPKVRRGAADPSEGRQVGAGVVVEAALGGRDPAGVGNESGAPSPRAHPPPSIAVTHPPFIPDQDAPCCPDSITKEKRTPAPEPESREASEPPAKKSKR